MYDLVRKGGDSFGKALLDFYSTGEEAISLVIRTEDGNEEEMPSSEYFNAFENWSPIDRALTQWIDGRVLDIGTGAGRLALYLQETGHQVVAIDLSDGAMEVSRARGVSDVRRHDILAGPLDGEKFDSICLFGMNLGIAGLNSNKRNFLTTIQSMLNPGGRIIGTHVNWERTSKKAHIDFQRQLREQGRYPVEMVLKIRYSGIDEDFSWVLTNQDELRDLCEDVGLDVEIIIESSGGIYGYVLKLHQVEDSSSDLK